jgi:hypothetical protein
VTSASNRAMNWAVAHSHQNRWQVFVWTQALTGLETASSTTSCTTRNFNKSPLWRVGISISLERNSSTNRTLIHENFAIATMGAGTDVSLYPMPLHIVFVAIGPVELMSGFSSNYLTLSTTTCSQRGIVSLNTQLTLAVQVHLWRTA